MTYVNWHDAAAYADWAGKHLPTEAEREYAARGGFGSKQCPSDDEITHDNANYTGTSGKDQWRKCAPVSSFVVNGYELYDMTGHVAKWCRDRYDENTTITLLLRVNQGRPQAQDEVAWGILDEH